MRACTKCGRAPLERKRGIEVGHIFQLGDKYTKPMNMRYAGENGEAAYPLMGCYGIGIGRLAASVCEVRRDARGPVWPAAVAPWRVHLCCLRSEELSVKEAADRLYGELQSAGEEVICDDRKVSAGVMFADADLLGVPIRALVSPRSLRDGKVELTSRDGKIKLEVGMEDAAEAIIRLTREA